MVAVFGWQTETEYYREKEFDSAKADVDSTSRD